MNKKLFSILFILFLAGILSVSCSNADKTGSGSKVDPKYAGNWYMEGGDNQVFIVIKDNGDISFPYIESSMGGTLKKIEGSGSSYTATFSGQGAPDLVFQITFTDSGTGTVKTPDGITDNIVRR
ncbi:hypothetical protein [Brachyspira pulli]|uniref:hypothetical protein n=1 Tax=Brachyspira pulli TaxID=310721 RepID=UPI003006412E